MHYGTYIKENSDLEPVIEDNHLLSCRIFLCKANRERERGRGREREMERESTEENGVLVWLSEIGKRRGHL